MLVFHNVTGYQATIIDLQQKRQKATNSAYKDRLQQQIEEAKYVQLVSFITARVRSTTGRYCFHRCLSVNTWGGGGGTTWLMIEGIVQV